MSSAATLAEIGPALRLVRLAARRTQRSIAEAVGIAQAYVSDIESGKATGVTVAQLDSVARELGHELRLVPDKPTLPTLAAADVSAHAPGVTFAELDCITRAFGYAVHLVATPSILEVAS